MRIDIELDETSSQHLLHLQAETDLDFDEIVAAAILAYAAPKALAPAAKAPAKKAAVPAAKAVPAKKAQGKS